MIFSKLKIKKRKKATGFTPWNRPSASPVESRQNERSMTYSTGNSTGFTLLEMMVSVSIFTIVMTISIGAILTLNDSLQKAKLMRSAVENVSFALEGMAKKIRTGIAITCPEKNNLEASILPRNCPSGGDTIYFFYPENKKRIMYYLDNTGYWIEAREIEQNGNNVRNVVTGSDVSITSLKFYLTGACPVTLDGNNSTNCPSSDTNQPLVKITLTGKANIPGKTRFDTTFNLQTTVSSRILDNS